MSLLFSLQDISKSYGDDTLFTDLCIDFKEKEQMGLIGMNGSGKSTLLKIIAGIVQADEGSVQVHQGNRVVYLPQSQEFDSDKTVEEILYQSLDNHANPQAVSRATTGMDHREQARQVNRTLGMAGFVDPTLCASRLSGGWKKRLSIAWALCQQPDLLLLDEPTNHLDLSGILWLEQVLKTARFSFITISHDRSFLENVCQNIMEIGRYFARGYFTVQGTWQEFEKQRTRHLDAQKKQQVSLAGKMRREDAWLRQGAKARTTKARFRIEQAEKLRSKLSQVRARNRETAKVGLSFNDTGRKTRKLIRAHNLGRNLGGTSLFSGITFDLGPGMCLGITGDNGAGKSTLLSFLAKQSMPDTGTVKWAENLKIAMFDQNRDQLCPDDTLRKALNPEGGDAVLFQGRSVHIVSWAKRFLFMPDQLDMPVSKLSGGEKARIMLSHLMRTPCDLLLLDEPTNDLDIPCLEILENSIREFAGAVILVSHDRYLMDQVCNGILYLDSARGHGFFRNIAQVMAFRNEKQPQKNSLPEKSGNPENCEKKISKSSLRSRPGNGFTYTEQHELDQMEEKILNAETTVQQWEEKLKGKDVMENPELLADICNHLETAQSQVDSLYARWEELEEKRHKANQDIGLTKNTGTLY